MTIPPRHVIIVAIEKNRPTRKICGILRLLFALHIIPQQDNEREICMNTIKVVTFNARCVYFDKTGESDGVRSFIFRAGYIYDKIQNENPDIILFQEFFKGHLDIMKKLLCEYEFFGHFRGEDFSGEGVYTAVKREKFQILGIDSYWLSPTPYTPGSRYENQSECPRTCLTIKVRDIVSGKIFRVLNTHLDHVSDEARILGIKQILEHLCKENTEDKIPCIIGGDFNAKPLSETITYCNNFDKIKLFDITDNIPVTFHNWGKMQEKIDYIYVSEDLKDKVQSVYAWEDEIYGMYLSDHYPVCAQFVTE